MTVGLLKRLEDTHAIAAIPGRDRSRQFEPARPRALPKP
jgi:hypothetical protein